MPQRNPSGVQSLQPFLNPCFAVAILLLNMEVSLSYNGYDNLSKIPSRRVVCYITTGCNRKVVEKKKTIFFLSYQGRWPYGFNINLILHGSPSLIQTATGTFTIDWQMPPTTHSMFLINSTDVKSIPAYSPANAISS